MPASPPPSPTAATTQTTADGGRPWSEPDDYTYEATISVFGPTAGTWRITVLDREVASAEPLDDIAEYYASDYLPLPEEFPTLTGLIEHYNLVMTGDPHIAVLERSTDGTPRRLELDPDKDTYDDEYAVEVHRVEVG
ncbi:DUF6174 domain-containing protein [Demequina gelatinilytica]|uniref:DUF6174 domain-containing protein n=1 Tax=Demequina gelatinilytica TaxID=1638980 RepID=UPI0012E01F55|nr:DUF6174 domain-containing protein [Demequina gelatinilytica]